MNEHDNGDHNRVGKRADALKRFRSDIKYTNDFFNMKISLEKYLCGYLDISEEMSQLIFEEMIDRLPDTELFETDPEMGREQMQLGLVRVVLPLMEQYGFSKVEYSQWLQETIPVALGPSNGRHGGDVCTEYNQGGINDVACEVSHNCPVKVVRQILVNDALYPDFESDAYREPWLYDTIYRTQIKVVTAAAKGLIDYEYAELVKKMYFDDLGKLNLLKSESN